MLSDWFGFRAYSRRLAQLQMSLAAGEYQTVIDAVDGFARAALTDDLRDGDTFKAAVCPGATASPIERIAAFSGREV